MQLRTLALQAWIGFSRVGEWANPESMCRPACEDAMALCFEGTSGPSDDIIEECVESCERLPHQIFFCVSRVYFCMGFTPCMAGDTYREE